MNETNTVPSIHSKDFVVDWDSTAPSGVLSLTGILNYIQITAGEHANMCRFGFYDMIKAGQAWVLTRMKIQFSSLPKWNEEIQVKTWIETLNGSVSNRNLTFSHKGEVFAQVSTVWMCLSIEKRMPETLKLPCPVEIFTDKNLEIGVAGRVRIPEELSSLRDYKVAYSDIDAMGHVNNIKYTQWILDSLPYKTALGIKSGIIEVNFLSELHAEDEVEIKYASLSDDGEAVFHIQKKGSTKPAFLSHYTPLKK